MKLIVFRSPLFFSLPEKMKDLGLNYILLNNNSKIAIDKRDLINNSYK